MLENDDKDESLPTAIAGTSIGPIFRCHVVFIHREFS